MIGVAFSFTMRPGIPLTLTAEARGQSARVQSEKLPEAALTRPLTEVEVTRQSPNAAAPHIMHNRFTVTLRRA